jgi:hypothetical protein
MLSTYIKNRGTSKTIIHNNNHNHVKQLNWDTDYDGNVANISLDLNKDGKHDHYYLSLDNHDLATILNVPSVNSSIENRLKNDFLKSSFTHEPSIYQIESQDIYQPPIINTPSTYKESYQNKDIKYSLPQEINKSVNPIYTHISSPLQNEELIVPLTINDKTIDKYTFTPKRRHKKTKTHKTHRVYKKLKSHKLSNHKRKSKTNKSFSLF